MNKLDRNCTVLNQIGYIYGDFAREKGLTYTRLAVIYCVYTSDAVSQRMICESWMLAKQTVNNETMALYKEGSIDFVTDPNDKRCKLIVSTDEGTKRYKSIAMELFELEKKVIARCGDELMDRMYNDSLKLKVVMEEVFCEKK